jgi:hypothetical protein
MGTSLWAPLALDAEAAARRNVRYLTVVGRLADGRSLEDAKARMAVVSSSRKRSESRSRLKPVFS